MQYLRAGETLTQNYAVILSDGTAADVTQVVTVTITGQNDGPVAAAISGRVDENGSAVTLSPIFTEVDDGDTHSFSVDTAGTKGSVIVNSNGTFSYDPNGQFESLKAGATATDTFTYTVKDSSDAISTQTATVTITGQNDALELTGTKATLANGTEDTAYTVTKANLLAGYTDVDLDTLSVVELTASNGTVTPNSDGSFTITPTANFNGPVTLSYGVSDGTAITLASQSYTLAPVNDAPELTGTKATLANGTEDTAYTVTKANLLAGYTDVDLDALSVVELTASNGTVTPNSDGSFTITPTANFNGPVTLSYGVSDGTAITLASQSYTLDAVTEPAALLWRNTTTGTLTEWTGNGNGFDRNTYVNSVSVDWSIGGVGDFDGDGKSDILWHNDTTGEVTVWQGTDTGFDLNTYDNVISTDWLIGGVGDFNGDGKSDILWRNKDTGVFSAWQGTENGFNPNAYVDQVSPDWLIGGIGDFNGDGKSDILWPNKDTGTFTEWQGTENGFNRNAYVDNVSTDWLIGGVGDFNGDSKSDILWRNKDTGAFTEWQGTGDGFNANTYIDAVSTDWTVTVKPGAV